MDQFGKFQKIYSWFNSENLLLYIRKYLVIMTLLNIQDIKTRAPEIKIALNTISFIAARKTTEKIGGKGNNRGCVTIEARMGGSEEWRKRWKQ